MARVLRSRRTRETLGPTVIATIMMTFAMAASSEPTEETKPAEVLYSFMDAFHDFDYATCRSLLAQEAVVTITRRLEEGKFHRHQGDAFQWIDEVGEEVKPLRDWTWKALESHTVMNIHGATVVLRYRSTAKAPGGRFTNNGTDVATLVREQGRWKILQYDMFEDFDWKAE